MALFLMPALAMAVLPPPVVLRRLGVQIARLEHAATRDGTTGLFNPNGWRALAESVVVRRDRCVGTGVLMIDRYFNRSTTYGHVAGNAMLAAVPAAIVRSIRDKDTASRFGGDEFVVLLSEITSAELARVAERVRAVRHAALIQALLPLLRPRGIARRIPSPGSPPRRRRRGAISLTSACPGPR
jgi:GGDEF domain-containing protein